MSWAPPAEGLTKGKSPFPVASGEALCPPGYQVRLWGTAVLSPGPRSPGALAIPGDYQHGGAEGGAQTSESGGPEFPPHLCHSHLSAPLGCVSRSHYR